MLSHIHPDNYDAQLEKKKAAMQALFAEFSVPQPQIFESQPLHYRLRAEFRVWHEGDDLYYIMFDQQSKQKFRVDQFLPASEIINEAMPALLDDIRDKDILRRKLFQVDFLSTLSGELLISMLYHKPLDEEWQSQAKLLNERLNKLANISIIGRARKQKEIIGKDFVTEELKVDGKQFRYHQVENSFTQPNGGVNEKMLSWARAATKDIGGDLVELYCGNGNFSIALAENFDKVLATEISKSSVASAQINIEDNGIENLKIIRMSSEEFSQAMNGERTFRRLEGLDLKQYGYQTVLVDPPRAGLDPDSVELASRFDQILYISCNPNTLRDNLKTLIKTHEVESFALFDQFPYTDHIECGVVLKRRK
ncbi:tRNA (uridine(54)-C5)-methyltransferase TrmA [Thalassotalea sp. PS06]|uniref:tRNA (uridine(54)-C5)-methyltransferase TrmA n=1 Tax=Thalassotalea sp. PS06 TaxID=2594005 RepID=UPI00116527EE|nr:tRNA (uridine(54)-C5)-methyltransferase TrmA [Thalassotalea sp. PS06]QDP02502.1 tRNA (uridine(54)-C5)-methyltransferase TrmA [Thalassotalea sp. PS06]